MRERNGSRSPGANSAPPVTAAWLERVALHYLDRYSATAETLRRVLARRVEARAGGAEAEAFAGLIAETVERAVRAGLVDDARFAAARLASLRRRGASTRTAGAALAAKGVARTLVEAALAAEREEAETQEGREDDGASAVELAAAQAYARRRRIGPHRPAPSRAACRERDLAAMARAGFSYALARSVIDARDEDADDP